MSTYEGTKQRGVVGVLKRGRGVSRPPRDASQRPAILAVFKAKILILTAASCVLELLALYRCLICAYIKSLKPAMLFKRHVTQLLQTQVPSANPASYGGELPGFNGAGSAYSPLSQSFDAFVCDRLNHYHVPGLAVAVVHGGETFSRVCILFCRFERNIIVSHNIA